MQTRPAAPESEPRQSTLGYLPGLDGLRAVSVLAVLAFHHYLIGGHEPGFAPGGYRDFNCSGSTAYPSGGG